MSTKMESNPYGVLDDELSKKRVNREQQLSYVDHALQKTGANISWAAGKTKQSFDRVVTPEQQRVLSERYQGFAQSNPRLAAFLTINIILSGIPVALFTIFSLSVFAFSLITGLILGLIGALLFTSTVVGIALIFLVPTLLLTTAIAITIFFWGLVGLFIYTQYEQRRR